MSTHKVYATDSQDFAKRVLMYEFDGAQLALFEHHMGFTKHGDYWSDRQGGLWFVKSYTDVPQVAHHAV